MTTEEFIDWANLPENDDRRFELDRGRPVELPLTGERHGLCCWLAVKVLTEYLARRGTGYMLTNGAGILVERNPDSVLCADLMLFLSDPRPDGPRTGFVDDIPDLVVEVLSPEDRAAAVAGRVSRYLRRGVPLVWCIDPGVRSVMTSRLNEPVLILHETDELTGNGVLPDFACPVRALFALTPTP